MAKRVNEVSTPDSRRRRLLQGGLGAAPVLMTLVSRPVLGGDGGGIGQCAAPSGFASMPTSQHGQPQLCLGRSPGYWKNHQDWPAPYYAYETKWHDATLFKAYFVPSPYPWQTTFLEVLNLGGGPPTDVARHVVATALNIARGWIPAAVLSLARLQVIWQEFMTKDYFEPTAGVKWYHDDITDYLKSTMDGGSDG